ncbi:MAG: hypothetical protein FD153_513 [Rhodospirillaceae bacterium]|nr:MAG: hypothetical protein FD153_513 [Rhodospirillaceae bacterium]
MPAFVFNTMKFVRRLRAADFSESQAEVIAEALKEAGEEAEVVTRWDIEQLEAAMRAESQAIRVEESGN